METRRKLVVGNWKMHGSRASVKQLLQELLAASTGPVSGAEIAVCPVYVHLELAAEILKGTHIALGAQDAHPDQQGAFTGEVSVAMLPEFGVRYVITGHSERRTLFAETDQLVASKFMAIQQQQMQPILCVGETLQQREANQTEQVVSGQLQAVIDAAGVEALANAVIAYEPVWAIGTGQTATPEQAQAVHEFLRAEISARDASVGRAVSILYGGSVKAANAAELFAQPDIDGALVGGASLQAEEFVSIFNVVS